MFSFFSFTTLHFSEVFCGLIQLQILAHAHRYLVSVNNIYLNLGCFGEKVEGNDVVRIGFREGLLTVWKRKALLKRCIRFSISVEKHILVDLKNTIEFQF